MPRKMPQGWMTLIGRPDKQIEEHSTLKISIDDGDILRDYHFATARLIIDGAVYEPQLRAGDQIKTSLTRAVDQATSQAQNADTETGAEFLLLGQALYGARAEVGRYWLDHISGIDAHKVFQVGPVNLLKVNEEFTAITAIADPYAHISVGASRRVESLCQFEFRNKLTCTYDGPLQTCNFMLHHLDGCAGRHGVPLNRARNGSFVFLNSGSRFKAL